MAIRQGINDMDEASGAPAVAVVGLGCILPDAPDVRTFWQNIKSGRYSVTDVEPDRWDPALYYDPDPKAPQKTYSKIGGWVRDWSWDPGGWHLALPPRVADEVDITQKWAIACTKAALDDYGYPSRRLEPERTAVILGGAISGERHYLTSMGIYYPEYAKLIQQTPSFRALPDQVRASILDELLDGAQHRFPRITEDTLPGELGNILAGRVANLFNFRGAGFTVDAACASALAALDAAFSLLVTGEVDAVVGGGVDRNMGANLYVKFSKIGALSATGTRPYADGADGFVMGEGGAVLLMKRLADAERDGDTIYAVIRGVGGSSDGRGKGITAPNPIGQRLALERAWKRAGVSPGTVNLLEGHGTSTRVGDVVEVESLHAVFGEAGLATGSVALGSVKSNIGHLKSAAGAAGLLKTVLALHHKLLPPSLHCEQPNPGIDFAHSPFRVNTELRDWEVAPGVIRRAGVSAFGFGGANFHAVVDEYVPGAIDAEHRRSTAVIGLPLRPDERPPVTAPGSTGPSAQAIAPVRGALVVGGPDQASVVERLRRVLADAEGGQAPAPALPAASDLHADHRVAIDYADAADLADKTRRALSAFENENEAAAWGALANGGVFHGHGPAPKLAFLFTGQGSQYVNMLRELRRTEPVVAATFAEADAVMTPILGSPLSDLIFTDEDSSDESLAARRLDETAVTQPAVLTVDIAIARLLSAYGIVPDMVAGHSLGEYAALVVAGSIDFADALRAGSARGRAVAALEAPDPGKMAAVFAPLDVIERAVATTNGSVRIVNYNSTTQAVIAGASEAMDRVKEALQQEGSSVVPLHVSHAFHTEIVAPAGEALRDALRGLTVRPPELPIVANLTGDFYSMDPGSGPAVIDSLVRHLTSPVQFIKSLHTLHDAGARVFLEVGPKHALHGFVRDVLRDDPSVVALFTNHPKHGDLVSFNHALCGLYAAGLGASGEGTATAMTEPGVPVEQAAAPVADFTASDAVPRRVPVPVLRPPLDLCLPSGVTLVAASRVVVMPDTGGVCTALLEELAARGVTPLVLDRAADAAALETRLRSWLDEAPVQGVYWLPALDAEGELHGMDLAAWHEALRVRIKSLSTTMRTLYDSIGLAGTFLVSAVRLGGKHGYDEAGAEAPLGGSVSGFTKAYKRERPDALVKTVDFETGATPADVSRLLIGETLRDPGAVEIGHCAGLRWTVGLVAQPAADGQRGIPLTKDTVFVVTGAAGGIVSAIVGDLAEASGASFHLLDLAPEPDPDNQDLAKIVSDRDGLKHDLIARITARGERPTPVAVERELAGLERQQAALAALTAVRAAGGAAHYHRVDLTDAAAVAAVIDRIRAMHGRIDVLVHAAGIEISHLLPDKSPREFDLVFDVKSDGWFNLLHAIGDMPLGATVAFTSVAGRFGNGGQTDYSAANDMLCKLTSHLRRTRPATRGIAVDWTAWTGIGMATRGSIPKMMELAGIDMLGPDAGVPVVRRELTAGGTRGEVVIADRLGMMLDEWNETGGLDPAAVVRGPMIGADVSMGIHSGLTVRTTLDPAEQGFLRDHAMDGTPLLPGVMGVEAFAELASLPLPGWSVAAVEDVHFDAPFKFYRAQPRTLTLRATFREDGPDLMADCSMIGIRELRPGLEPQVTTHFRGRVRMSRAPAALAAGPVAPLDAPSIPSSVIYDVLFHGPAYQVLAEERVSGRNAAGALTAGLPDDHMPMTTPFALQPRLMELCLQTSGVWELATSGRLALPLGIERAEAAPAGITAAGRVTAQATARDDGAFDVVVSDEAGTVLVRMRGYRSIALPGGGDANAIRLLQAAATAEGAASRQ
jgi:acyl transferase domain-containing protein/NAD(P)-dependent dehydrogenase (short-subunit alcohol dehydrogenase family)